MFAVFNYKGKPLVKAHSILAFYFWWNEGLEPVINHQFYGKWSPDAMFHAEEFFPSSSFDAFKAYEISQTPIL